jgi:hypothetical protein
MTYGPVHTPYGGTVQRINPARRIPSLSAFPFPSPLFIVLEPKKKGKEKGKEKEKETKRKREISKSSFT